MQQKELVVLKSGRDTNVSNEDLGDVLNNDHLDSFITDGAVKFVLENQP